MANDSLGRDAFACTKGAATGLRLWVRALGAGNRCAMKLKGTSLKTRTELGIGPAPHDALHATDDHVVVATQGVPWVQLCDAGIWPETAAGQ